ncbi:hypothetical protein QCB45_01105 [Thiomicrorhabdus sp. ZW0627]|uniref:hypothetical protein n=1 Tax=Thiomicrorhabdus sp. ZW0627 TaxID=3039774 RepID=UPI002436CD21|nr:hypothetical protein [Thiomicrorhabdus sp. ZW0627]MDG6772918.1 hypothetical protein [Thiomicrorhabdus sp. ZW0627]
MFCLFKNSHIHPALNRYVVLLSWLGVVAWLYFAFIEKELVLKLFKGHAVMVDLLLGIPLVLMLAVVVYATIYWLFKLLIIYLLPHAVIPANQEDLTDSLDDESFQKELESQYGEEYWQQQEDEASNAEKALDSFKSSQQAGAETPDSGESNRKADSGADRHSS